MVSGKEPGFESVAKLQAWKVDLDIGKQIAVAQSVQSQ